MWNNYMQNLRNYYEGQRDREVMNIVGGKIDEFLMRIHYNN